MRRPQRDVQLLGSVLVVLIILSLSAGPADACAADLSNYIKTCEAIFNQRFSLSLIHLHLCPEYWRTSTCRWSYLQHCNSTVQTQYNQTFAGITVYMDGICQIYTLPQSQWPTATPNCNITEIYIEVQSCIGTLENDIRQVSNLFQLSGFCKKYKRAWACADPWVQSCTYSQAYFNLQMTNIKTTLDPYCGSPDGSTPLVSSVATCLLLLAATRMFTTSL